MRADPGLDGTRTTAQWAPILGKNRSYTERLGGIKPTSLLNISLPSKITQIDDCKYGFHVVGNILSFINSIP